MFCHWSVENMSLSSKRLQPQEGPRVVSGYQKSAESRAPECYKPPRTAEWSDASSQAVEAPHTVSAQKRT
jgi:hypothetical protein